MSNLMPDCTIEERTKEIKCYIIMPDGTVWAEFVPCVHGLSEVSPLWHPKVGRLNDETAPVAAETVQ